ncbi:DNA photolyase family protein [Ancylobacter sp. 6x-1]|uniref:DNA photolyase family protein n=1 Tax=Ancylobacter crimeensis TaxID=2579147 RepID=A0ABT0DFZ3_9HYPH|nr:deoxyribodipyrimidine photo-lyase [Ancylobacter crimeensis]MCK0198880.1 DNA photolyase family protein [Ancylobacter crimeensis]
MTTARPALVWFRDDLRLADHPALAAATASGRPLVALYVLDEMSPDLRPLGGAARWWLGEALAMLGEDIARAGGELVLRRGPAREVVADLVAEAGIGAVYWNHRHLAPAAAIDNRIAEDLAATGIEHHGFPAALLHDPDAVRTKGGTPFRMFTPFHRAASAGPLRAVLPKPVRFVWAEPPRGDHLADWALAPGKPDWTGGLRATWTPGEAGAHRQLGAFLAEGFAGYATTRDRPDLPGTSRLSPFLRFGHLSPHQVVAALHRAREAGSAPPADVAAFERQLWWREFAWHLLAHFPGIERRNVQPRFDALRWRHDDAFLAAWQQGCTGYPIVDAGMRQLWQTGWMHNRVRMVSASLLVKHGLIHWNAGEAWFWDTLVDADAANNAMNWQWVAGTGADAAPYLRVFNPVLQGRRFDPDGAYIRAFVPELARLSPNAIHAPWQAEAAVLDAAGVTLGVTYPHPIIGHEVGRERALRAYAAIRD